MVERAPRGAGEGDHGQEALAAAVIGKQLSLAVGVGSSADMLKPLAIGMLMEVASWGAAPWFFPAALVAALGAIVPRAEELALGISNRERSGGP